METIISLFLRNHESDQLVRNEVTLGAEWVIAGQGRPTRKFDGTCCRIKGGRLFRRLELKPGKEPPVGFEPAGKPDAETGKQPGWVPVGPGPDDRRHREGYEYSVKSRRLPLCVGTYELIGPKVQRNPERVTQHMLIQHGVVGLPDVPRTFVGIREYLSGRDIEGIVWHHPDGRMVKIKAEDFGIERGGDA